MLCARRGFAGGRRGRASPGSAVRAGRRPRSPGRPAAWRRPNKDLLRDRPGSPSGKMAGGQGEERAPPVALPAGRAGPRGASAPPPRARSRGGLPTPVMQGIAMRPVTHGGDSCFSSSRSARPRPSPLLTGRGRRGSLSPERGRGEGSGGRPPSLKNVSGMFPVGVGRRAGAGPAPTGQHVLGRVGVGRRAGRRWGPTEPV